jgi:NADH dehydrogenase
MNITIVGSGFGGVKAALLLAKNKKNNITIITNNSDFQYYPGLYRVATGYTRKQVWVPLTEIFDHINNVTVVTDTILAIDKTQRRLLGESGLGYDYETLIMALGAVTTYFGIPGLDQFAYGIKSASEIKRLHDKLHSEFMVGGKLDAHYVIVGAGPTGIELSAALMNYLKDLRKHYKLTDQKLEIDLIEAAPRVLPKMSEATSAKATKRLQKLGINVQVGKAVESATAEGLMVSGQPLESSTVIWTSGVANNPFYKANEASFSLAKNGKVVVDDYLRLEKDIYVIGDNAATAYSGLAQTAVRDAVYVAHAITEFSKHRTPAPYSAKLPPVVVPVDEAWAVFEWRSIRLSGGLASLIRLAADFVGYSDILPFGHALKIWRNRRMKDTAYYGPTEAN